MNSNKKPRVINIGIQNFYLALIRQKVKAIQIQWRPPAKWDKEVMELLDKLL
jgi:hypothetical protein